MWPGSLIDDEDEDRCLQGKVSFFFFFFFLTCLISPSPPLSFCWWKGWRGPPCMWRWLWHHFATFVTSSRGVKVPPKIPPTHPHPFRPFIGVPAQQQLHSHLFSCQKSVSLLLPMSHVIHTTQHHSDAPWAVGESACSVWNAMWFSGPTCFNCTVWFHWGKGVKRSVCERGVSVECCYTVESKSTWTVSHFSVVLPLWASTLDLKFSNVHKVKVSTLGFKSFFKARGNELRLYDQGQTDMWSEMWNDVICVSPAEDRTYAGQAWQGVTRDGTKCLQVSVGCWPAGHWLQRI